MNSIAYISFVHLSIIKYYSDIMKDAFIKLHISIILAGATGIFGKLISLNEALLVWYRMMLASLLFLLVLSVGKRLNRISFGDALRIGGLGLLLGLHWVFFYGSIKASNVSIGVVCFSLVGFFTAFLEPLINCHRVSFKEVVFSLLTLFGVVLIFHFDTRYRLGIGLGIISSALAALFTITNKKIGNNYSTSTMLLYEMVGGFIGLSCILDTAGYFRLYGGILWISLRTQELLKKRAWI